MKFSSWIFIIIRVILWDQFVLYKIHSELFKSLCLHMSQMQGFLFLCDNSEANMMHFPQRYKVSSNQQPGSRHWNPCAQPPSSSLICSLISNPVKLLIPSLESDRSLCTLSRDLEIPNRTAQGLSWFSAPKMSVAHKIWSSHSFLFNYFRK